MCVFQEKPNTTYDVLGDVVTALERNDPVESVMNVNFMEKYKEFAAKWVMSPIKGLMIQGAK